MKKLVILVLLSLVTTAFSIEVKVVKKENIIIQEPKLVINDLVDYGTYVSIKGIKLEYVVKKNNSSEEVQQNLVFPQEKIDEILLTICQELGYEKNVVTPNPRASVKIFSTNEYPVILDESLNVIFVNNSLLIDNYESMPMSVISDKFADNIRSGVGATVDSEYFNVSNVQKNRGYFYLATVEKFSCKKIANDFVKSPKVKVIIN